MITPSKFKMRYLLLIFIIIFKVNAENNGKLMSDLKHHIGNFQNMINETLNSFQDIFQILQRKNVSSKEKIENAIDKYDEVIENLEAYFSANKIQLGLQLEKSIEDFNKKQNAIEQMLFGSDVNSLKILQASRERILETFKQAILDFNSLIQKGMDNFMLISEKGKELIKDWNERSDNLKSSNNKPNKIALSLTRAKEFFTRPFHNRS